MFSKKQCKQNSICSINSDGTFITYTIISKGTSLKGVINSKGKLIVPEEFKAIKFTLYGIEVGGQKGIGIYNYDGNIIIEPIYSNINYSNNIFFAITENGTVVFFNCMGKKLIEGDPKSIFNNYDKCINSPEAIQKNPFLETIGILNNNGQIYIPSTYMFFEEKNKLGVINKDKEIILPAKYETIKFLIEGIQVINTSGVGLFSYTGNELIKPIYAKLIFTEYGILAKSTTDKGSYWGVFSFLGEKILDPIWLKTSLKENGILAFSIENSVEICRLFDYNGKEIIDASCINCQTDLNSV